VVVKVLGPGLVHIRGILGEDTQRELARCAVQVGRASASSSAQYWEEGVEGAFVFQRREPEWICVCIEPR